MADAKEVTLPSGAKLKIGLAPFAEAKALYQALLRELRVIPFSAKTDMAGLYKDLFCAGFASDEVEKALWVCFKRCQYCDKRGDLKIDDQTFEPVEAREDYLTACMEVAKENTLPFVKSLYAEYGQYFSILRPNPA